MVCGGIPGLVFGGGGYLEIGLPSPTLLAILYSLSFHFSISVSFSACGETGSKWACVCGKELLRNKGKTLDRFCVSAWCK